MPVAVESGFEVVGLVVAGLESEMVDCMLGGLETFGAHGDGPDAVPWSPRLAGVHVLWWRGLQWGAVSSASARAGGAGAVGVGDVGVRAWPRSSLERRCRWSALRQQAGRQSCWETSVGAVGLGRYAQSGSKVVYIRV